MQTFIIWIASVICLMIHIPQVYGATAFNSDNDEDTMEVDAHGSRKKVRARRVLGNRINPPSNRPMPLQSRREIQPTTTHHAASGKRTWEMQSPDPPQAKKLMASREVRAGRRGRMRSSSGGGVLRIRTCLLLLGWYVPCSSNERGRGQRRGKRNSRPDLQSAVHRAWSGRVLYRDRTGKWRTFKGRWCHLRRKVVHGVGWVLLLNRSVLRAPLMRSLFKSDRDVLGLLITVPRHIRSPPLFSADGRIDAILMGEDMYDVGRDDPAGDFNNRAFGMRCLDIFHEVQRILLPGSPVSDVLEKEECTKIITQICNMYQSAVYAPMPPTEAAYGRSRSRANTRGR